MFTCVGFVEAVQTAVAAHDTTGGMATKIAEAASIAAMGIDVYVVEVMYTISCPCFSLLQSSESSATNIIWTSCMCFYISLRIQIRIIRTIVLF